MDSTEVTLVAKGDSFADSKGVTTAIQRSFLHQGKGCFSVGGGGFSKLICCSGCEYDKTTKRRKGCPAKVRACKSRRRNVRRWTVTEVCFVHKNCHGEQKSASLASVEKMIAVHVRANPKISGPGLVRTLKSTAGINVTPRTALRAKAKALGRTPGACNAGYTALTSLLDHLGSTKGNYTDTSWEKGGRFKRCFVMLAGATKVAANSPNKAFCLDGAHLKGSFNGVILTITTTDANNRVNIVAFAVVRRENSSSYKYLIEQALRSKKMKKFLNNEKSTCFTDGQNGVDSAVAKLLPMTELRHCLEHQLRGVGLKGKVGKGLAYKASRSMTEVQFDSYMDQLHGIDPDAHDKLMEIPHHLWAHYAGRKNVCWDQVTTNPAESANSMLLELRRLPVYDLVHGAVLLIAKRLCEASELKKDDESQVNTPFVAEHFEKASAFSRKLTASPLGEGRYLVSDSVAGSTRGENASVAWNPEAGPKFECTCGVPQKMQLPCSHVLAAVEAQKKTREALSLLSKSFKMSRYRRLAAGSTNMPVWDELEKDPGKKPPRIVERLDGKKSKSKRTTRIASKGEGPQRKKRKKS